MFRKSAKFSEVQAVCPTLAASPLVGLFQSGYAELNTQLRTDRTDAAKPAAAAARPTLKSLDAVDRALLRATTVELNKLEHRVPFLATTASITPFIGLFGTVWGIVIAFQGIASAGNTSLGVVAQPIAEALIATAAGLFAAIPAVYFYNHFTSKVKKSRRRWTISRWSSSTSANATSPRLNPQACRKFSRQPPAEEDDGDAARACRRRSPRSTSCRSST